MKGVMRLAAGAALAVIGLQPVSAACWSDQAIEAATLRDFDAMLMTATLRCRVQGVDLTAGYNKFMREKRTVLAAADDVLQAQFAADGQASGKFDAFDRYAATVRASHVADTPAQTCLDYRQIVEAALAASPDRAALVALARQAGAAPLLPNGRCGTQIAFAP